MSHRSQLPSSIQTAEIVKSQLPTKLSCRELAVGGEGELKLGISFSIFPPLITA